MGEREAERSKRDIARFDAWAPTYESQRGWAARFFPAVHAGALKNIATVVQDPERILDVGCGTGAFLRRAAERFPDAGLTGVDPAPRMIEEAGKRTAGNDRFGFSVAAAEELPFDDGSFDLVTTSVSFHHWRDQRRGLAEVARVLRAGGHFCLTDILAVGLLRPFMIGRRDRFHTRREITAMLSDVGLRQLTEHPALRGFGEWPYIKSVVAIKD